MFPNVLKTAQVTTFYKRGPVKTKEINAYQSHQLD